MFLSKRFAGRPCPGRSCTYLVVANTESIESRALVWVSDYLHLLEDEQSVGADLDYFTDDDEPLTFSRALEVFESVREAVAKIAPKRGALLIVPLERRSSLEAEEVDYSEFAARVSDKWRLPSIYMLRKSAANAYEFVEERRLPLKWPQLGEGAIAYVRTWRTSRWNPLDWEWLSSGESPDFNSAVYIRSIPGDRDYAPGLDLW